MGNQKSLAESALFVGVDGEGWNVPGADRFVVGESDYRAPPHRFTLLAAYPAEGDGAELWREGKRLTMTECLDFLCDAAATQGEPGQQRRRVLVSYASSYDAMHMLAFDLPRESLVELADGLTVHARSESYSYEIEYRPRKFLRVRRYSGTRGRRWHTWAGRRVVQNEAGGFTLWDWFGFAQSRFTEALRAWGFFGSVVSELERMKGERAGFDASQIAAIRAYNESECRLLAAMAGRARDFVVDELGVKPARWHGASAVAGELLRANKVKAHMLDTAHGFPAAFEAARHAYVGGHIETMGIGVRRGPVWHADLNSAYAAALAELPSLGAGTWEHGETGTEPPEGFTVIRLAYRFPAGRPFYPLPFRRRDHSVCFPPEGEGWHWRPEYEAALAYAGELGMERLDVLEWWHWRPSPALAHVRPFDYVRELYAMRGRVEGGRAGGRSLLLKLVLTATFGKLSQQTGAELDEHGELVKLPPWFQLEWAGWVTAAVRARVMLAALDAPGELLTVNTDGLWTGKRPRVRESDELGGWRVERIGGLAVAMAGAYWTADDEAPGAAYTKGRMRGFEARGPDDFRVIARAWRRRSTTAELTTRRLIGLRSAVKMAGYWRMRGRYAEAVARMPIDGESSKRHGVAVSRVKPHTQWCPTLPKEARDGLDGEELAETASAPHPLLWIEGAPDAVEQWEAEREEGDAAQD